MGKKLLFMFFVSVIFYQNAFAKKHFGNECCEEYCYSADEDQEQIKYLSCNTAYQLVKGNDYADQYMVPNCKPVRFWLLSRHGARLLEREEIEALPELVSLRDQIIENYEVKKSAPAKGALCDQDLQLIKNWEVDKNITKDKDEYLTVQGWNDAKGLAEDYKKVYPELLGREYDPNKFLFYHTGKQQMEASMKAFMEGLFGPGVYNGISQFARPKNDSFLIPMKYCRPWAAVVDNLKTSDESAMNKFITSPLFAQMLADVSRRLGFDNPLTFKQVQLIYNLCAYEKAWFFDKPSPWCSVLTLEQVKIMEYEYDLFYQYRSGYGNDYNHHLPCEVMKDMLSRMAKDEEPRVTAYFSHSIFVQMFATALGI
ncbi:unnamed protein product [Hermetia illucens]|uniref:Multiple inositol polyphosphate phosphatase 1 n=1 Tax=Hermetia illucens TaxID=343691 RepID=A0A7R8UL41_HERIL|nr:multiple inositol polyphosphate phosphatase 1-like [Hermetia illucens]CAD7082628.1 unnamed protein product [Hermetia illucens]